MNIFQRIFVIQFLNLAVLFLISDFSVGFNKESLPVPILVGKYTDFDTGWYYDVGAKITMAMVSNSIAPFGKTIAEPFV